VSAVSAQRREPIGEPPQIDERALEPHALAIH
jgi:hypothetical protein